jgi:GcrA cell cycle regulator
MSKWNDERVKMLVDLWQGGYTARQISEKLGDGVTRNAVIGKANRLGLSAAVKSNVKREERAVDAAYMRSRTCQWPEGTPGGPNFYYCGNPVDPGYPYCAEHRQEAYRRKIESGEVAA